MHYLIEGYTERDLELGGPSFIGEERSLTRALADLSELAGEDAELGEIEALAAAGEAELRAEGRYRLVRLGPVA